MTGNIENINYSDFNNICRLCLLNCNVKFTRDSVISNIFYKLTDIHFDANGELPQQICLKCFDKINEIHEFAFEWKRAHIMLEQSLNTYKNIRLNNDHIQTNNASELVIVLENITLDNRWTKETNIVHDKSIVTRNILEYEDNINDTNEEQNQNSSENDLVDVNSSNRTDDPESSRNCAYYIDMPEDTNLTSTSKNFNQNSTELTSNNNKSSKRRESLRKCYCLYTSEDCSNLYKPECLKRNKCQDKGKPPLKCLQCSKSFTYLSGLNKHVRIHSGERPYKFHQCSKLFTQSSHLTRHMRVHSGERPYKCVRCSKSFTESSSLKKHIRIHSGERPYKCVQCSKSFTQSDHLKKHIRIHSSERPYKCVQCSKSFTQSSSLKTHMRIHNGERPYKCLNVQERILTNAS